jgi:hypothetical protein
MPNFPMQISVRPDDFDLFQALWAEEKKADPKRTRGDIFHDMLALYTGGQEPPQPSEPEQPDDSAARLERVREIEERRTQ